MMPVQGPEAGHGAAVWFDLLDAVSVDALEAFDFVLQPESVDFLEHGELVLRGRGDHLAADIVVDAIFLGKGHQFMAALDAIGGLERSGRVVQSAVDHAAVVAGLVIAQDVLLFEQGDAGVGVTALQLVERCGSDDAAADDDEVECVGRSHAGPRR